MARLTLCRRKLCKEAGKAQDYEIQPEYEDLAGYAIPALESPPEQRGSCKCLRVTKLSMKPESVIKSIGYAHPAAKVLHALQRRCSFPNLSQDQIDG